MKKTIFYKGLIILLFLIVNNILSAQTTEIKAFVYVYPQAVFDTFKLCEGDSVKILSRTLSTLINTDFNNGVLDTSIWKTNIDVLFTNPCPPNNLPASGQSCWFGSNNFPREIISKSIDLTNLNSGNYSISWDMKYGANQNTTNCESPDLPTEGVHLQWANSDSLIWHQFTGTDNLPSGNYGSTGYINGSGGYWTPVSGNAGTGPLYTWNHYVSSFPSGTNNQFIRLRFFQDISSGNTFDHWGIDNIRIDYVTNYTTVWKVDGVDTFYTQDTPFHIPSVGTHTYTVRSLNLSDFTFGSDTIILIVNPKPQKPVISYQNGMLISYNLYGNTWFLNNNTVQGNFPGINNNYIPLSNGSYQATCTSEYGCKSDLSLPVIVNDVSINDLENISEIAIYPNPAKEKITITHNHTVNKLKVLNIQGKELSIIAVNNSANEISLNISNLSNGIYFLQFQTDKGLINKKIIVTR